MRLLPTPYIAELLTAEHRQFNIALALSRVIAKYTRVLTKDSPENRGFFGEGVKVVVEVVVDPQRQIDHFDDLGDDLRAAAEPR